MPVYFINKSSGLNVEVMRRPMRPENIVKRHEIIRRDTKGNEVKTMMRAKIQVGHSESDGKPIYRRLQCLCPLCEPGVKNESCPLCKGKGLLDHFSNFEKVDVVNGEILSSGQKATYFIVKEDGTEEKTSKFDPSDAMMVLMELPRTKLHEFYIESWDELEAVSKKKKGEKVSNAYVEQELFKEAERYVAENVIGVGKFVKASGFKEWFFVCMPTIRDDGTFGWLVGYWQAKIEQTHLIPIPKAVELAPEKKTPAKSYLPELAALVS